MNCFRESLRIESPVSFSTSLMMRRDVTLAKGKPKELKIRAGDEIHLIMGLQHHDPRQWGPRHLEFIPERFDPTSEHYKTPDGKKRHPYSYTPFLGGHRICLGKTFAETVAKKMIAMVLKFYTMEHADPELKKKTFAYDIYQPQLPVIRFNYAKRYSQQ